MLSESKLQHLAELVATVETKFPLVMYKDGGSRAQEAAKLVELGQIFKAGDVKGVDYWRCHGYTSSIAGGGCTCADTLCVDEKKFCKHRLAAMFMVKLGGSPESKLNQLFADATGDELTLRVFVLHTADGDKYRMEGHRYGGQCWVRYDRDDCYDFTFAQFERVISDAGWVLASRPVKQPSMYFHYLLVRGSSGAYALNSAHAEAHERHLQNERFEELNAIQDLVIA